jgi:hypothetical protein
VVASGGRAVADTRKAVDNSSAQAATQAEVVLTDGSAVATARYLIRDKTLTVTLPRADDGAWAGLYRLPLDGQDALMGALLRLPAAVAGPPAVPGMPIARIVVRDRGKARDLVASLPTSDPAVDKFLLELRRCETIAQDTPALAISLEVQPVTPTAEPKAIAVRVLAKGERGAEVTFNPAHIRVEAAPEPKPVPAGFMPLPPRWVGVNTPFEGPPSRSVQAGAASDVKLAVKIPSREHRWFRAFLEGEVSFRTREGTSDVRVSLSSKPIHP